MIVPGAFSYSLRSERVIVRVPRFVALPSVDPVYLGTATLPDVLPGLLVMVTLTVVGLAGLTATLHSGQVKSPRFPGSYLPESKGLVLVVRYVCDYSALYHIVPGEGIEPPFVVSKATVLPLDDPGIN